MVSAPGGVFEGDIKESYAQQQTNRRANAYRARLILDGGTYLLRAPFIPLFGEFVNLSDVNITFTTDEGDAFVLLAGDSIAINLLPSEHWQYKSAALKGSGSAYVIFRNRERLLGSASSSSVASSVSISGAIQQQTGAVHHADSLITIAAGVGTLAARATRTGFTLIAPSTNAADIVLGTNVHIKAGGVFNGTAIDAIAVTGTNGDTLQVYEEYN